MTRSLFLSFFIRMTVILAVVAVLAVGLVSHGWIAVAVCVPAAAAVGALLLVRPVRKDILELSRAAAAMPEQPAGGNFDQIPSDQ